MAFCWLIGKKLSKFPEPVEIQLIEAEDVPVIGVGEGAIPTMLHTLQYMGIGEVGFVRSCAAKFKQRMKFSNWEKNPKISLAFSEI